jgi:transcriptional regulator of acetoin/glycerol metabolism
MARRGTETATETAVVLLASGKSVAAAAKASGLSKRTLFRQLKDHEVRARITEARRQLVD